MRRCLLMWRGKLGISALALVSISAVLATSATAADGDSPGRPSPGEPRQGSCYTRAQADEHLDGADLAFLEKLLPCEVRAVRPPGSGRFVVSPAVTRDAVGLIVRARSVTLAGQLRFSDRLLGSDGRAYCGARGGRIVQYAGILGDSQPPPALTPTWLGAYVRRRASSDHVFTEPGTVYGFAYARHVMSKDEPSPPDPVEFAMVGFRCLR